MLNRFYYMLEGLATAQPSGEDAVWSDNSITVAHVFDGSPGHARQLLEHHYSEAGNYAFCLVLQGDDLVDLVGQVLLLFFHPRYAMTEQGRPLFITTDDKAGRQALAQLCREQGLEVRLLSTAEARVLDTEGHDPAGDYYRYCLTNYVPEDIFFLTGGNKSGWTDELKRVEHELQENHERFYRLAAERFALAALAASQAREIDRLREERQIAQELLELNRRHDEVNYILHFYRNEYEILPLWYKRFGHVIKVIQGKRSFRSLFDKRVKKYKD